MNLEPVVWASYDECADLRGLTVKAQLSGAISESERWRIWQRLDRNNIWLSDLMEEKIKLEIAMEYAPGHETRQVTAAQV